MTVSAYCVGLAGRDKRVRAQMIDAESSLWCTRIHSSTTNSFFFFFFFNIYICAGNSAPRSAHPIGMGGVDGAHTPQLDRSVVAAAVNATQVSSLSAQK